MSTSLFCRTLVLARYDPWANTEMSRAASRLSALMAFRAALSALLHLSASVWPGPFDHDTKLSSERFTRRPSSFELLNSAVTRRSPVRRSCIRPVFDQTQRIQMSRLVCQCGPQRFSHTPPIDSISSTAFGIGINGERISPFDKCGISMPFC